jgi:hypothetical protein
VGAPKSKPNIAQMIAEIASMGQKAKWNCTVSAWPGTTRRVTWPAHSSGAQRLDQAGLSWPEAAIP